MLLVPFSVWALLHLLGAQGDNFKVNSHKHEDSPFLTHFICTSPLHTLRPPPGMQIGVVSSATGQLTDWHESTAGEAGVIRDRTGA